MKKFDSVEDLKADWKRIDRALIPHDLLVSMPQPECKGLTMLTDVMINATVCKLGPCIGQITAPYSDGIEIVLDVAGTIERRMPGRWWTSDHQRMRDRHLETRVRNSKTGVTAKVCIVAMGISVPAIDDCVAFVLWGRPVSPTHHTLWTIRYCTSATPNSTSVIERKRGKNSTVNIESRIYVENSELRILLPGERPF